MTPDIINGIYEFFGALLLTMSCWRLYRDKEMRGFSPVPTLFFATWGYWNLYFYPSLDQWWSFYGGIAMVLVNSFWLAQMAYYGWLAPYLEATRIIEKGSLSDVITPGIFKPYARAITEFSEPEDVLEHARLNVRGLRVGDRYYSFGMETACPYALVDERGNPLPLTNAEWDALQLHYPMVVGLIKRDGGVNTVTDCLLAQVRRIVDGNA